MEINYGLVSIITPNYNCGRFITKTIESIRNQTYKNWELLIQDDCSNDDSIEKARKLSSIDDRIKIQINPKNSGAAITRNNALMRAKGKWIAFLDSDDLWKPEKLEHQLRFMVENDYGFTYHEYSEIDELDNPLGITVSGKKHVGKLGMYSCCWPGCLSVIYDVEKVGLIQISDIKKNNDSAMWLKVIKKVHCHLLNENLALYRRRKGSITPPSIKARILWHYKLFREAEGFNPFLSCLLTGSNIIVNMIKKIFYIKQQGKQLNS